MTCPCFCDIPEYPQQSFWTEKLWKNFNNVLWKIRLKGVAQKICFISQDAPLLMNKLRKCGIYTQWNFMQP
jgi:hypothetical protein